MGVTPLTVPALQAYIDPVQGNCIITGAIAPESDQIVGYSSFSTYMSRFSFAEGAFLGSQEASALPVSLAAAPWSTIFDGAGQTLWIDKDGAANNVGIAQLGVGTVPWRILNSWGFGSAFSALPDNVPFFESQIFVTTNNTHWLVQGGLGGGHLTICRADPPDIGFWGHEYTDAAGGTVVPCAGPQNSEVAIVFWTGHHNLPGTCTFGSTVIGKDAIDYDPSTWPTPNPYITSTQIKSYAPTDFNAGWTSIISFSGPAYDRRNGNCLVAVSGTDGVTTEHYIVKINASTGAVMWQVPVESSAGFSDQGIAQSRIENSVLLYFAQTGGSTGFVHAIDTATGTDQSWPTTSQLGIGSQVSDDLLGCIIGNASWGTGGTEIGLLNGSPNTGSSMAAVYFIEAVPNPYTPGGRVCYARIWGNYGPQ